MHEMVVTARKLSCARNVSALLPHKPPREPHSIRQAEKKILVVLPPFVITYTPDMKLRIAIEQAFRAINDGCLSRENLRDNL